MVTKEPLHLGCLGIAQNDLVLQNSHVSWDNSMEAY
jgi:hypothetical protein